MTAMLTIRTLNPIDVTASEAEELAEAIRSLNLPLGVAVLDQEPAATDEAGYEVLHISLLGGLAFGLTKSACEEAVRRVADVAAEWARRRFRGRKQKSTNPVYVKMWIEDRISRSFVLKNADGEAEDRTEKDWVEHQPKAEATRAEAASFAKERGEAVLELEANLLNRLIGDARKNRNGLQPVEAALLEGILIAVRAFHANGDNTHPS